MTLLLTGQELPAILTTRQITYVINYLIQDDQCLKSMWKKKVKVGFFYSATYSGNAATSRAVQL